MSKILTLTRASHFIAVAKVGSENNFFQRPLVSVTGVACLRNALCARMMHRLGLFPRCPSETQSYHNSKLTEVEEIHVDDLRDSEGCPLRDNEDS